jgi:phospholipid/cholesterol/gamma-HCH transport system substrate-binding protein
MERRVAFILVGLFSLLLIGGFAAFVLWAHGRHEGGKANVSYVIEFEQAVNGLSVGSSVRYLGVEVGQVQKISLESITMPPRVCVIVGIDRTIHITQGDIATIKPSGITGVSFIDLRHDEQNSTPLIATAPGQLPVIRSEMSELDRLLSDAKGTARNLNAALEKISRLFNDGNLNHVNQTLGHLDKASGSLELFLNEMNKSGIQQNVSSAVRDSRQTMNRLSETMQGAKDAADSFSDLSQSLHDNPSRIIYPPATQGVEIKP